MEVTEGMPGKFRRKVSICGAWLPGTSERLDFAELVLFLEFGNFSGEAALREIQDFDEFGEFGEAAHHAGTVDDQFADGVHHAVEALEGDAHGFGLRQGFGSGAALFWRCDSGFCGCGVAAARGRGLRPGAASSVSSGASSAICARSGSTAARISSSLGPLAVQEFFQDVHGFQADVHDIGAGL